MANVFDNLIKDLERDLDSETPERSVRYIPSSTSIAIYCVGIAIVRAIEQLTQAVDERG